jgi:copper resistance protein D
MTDQLNIGIRFALYANLMLLFGLPLFERYALASTERLQNAVVPLGSVTIWLSISGIALSVLSITAMSASMMGMPLLKVDFASVRMMMAETPMGNAWIVRMFALLLTVATGYWMRGGKDQKALAFAIVATAIALASLAWTGHGAASEGTAGATQLLADITHLFGAGAWLGALAALTIMLLQDAGNRGEAQLRLTHRLLAGFSVAGTIIVALVVGSGLVNSWMLVGPQNLLTLPATLYGQVLIAKLLLFALMLALAATNRFRLTPAFERAWQAGGTSGVVAKLRKSLALELSIALIILGLVAWLGTLEPPISM